MAEIINLYSRRLPNPGNGAREALIDVALSLPGTEADTEADAWDTTRAAGSWSDWLLSELWVRGFKIVPLEPDNDNG